jgi:hypothetical protein
MTEMPVSVYQLFDRICIDAREGCRNVRTRRDDLRVHQQLSVGAGKDGDIFLCTVKDADIATKWLDVIFAVAASLNAPGTSPSPD